MRFTDFVAIDWSGAASGYAHKIAIARCSLGHAPPKLVARRGGWSREAVVDYLLETSTPATVVGFDFSFAPPFVDRRRYFRFHHAPTTAKKLWDYIEQVSNDHDLGCASFVQTHHDEFYRGAKSGDKSSFQRWRRCEMAVRANGGGKTSSIFDCVGAGQVAKASFSGMRLLHRLAPHFAIWPFESVASGESQNEVTASLRPVAVEIYCRNFLRLAGGSGNKVRVFAELNHSLAALASDPIKRKRSFSDDETDAMIASAGLRLLANQPLVWCEHLIPPMVRATEGWTFGVYPTQSMQKRQKIR